MNDRYAPPRSDPGDSAPPTSPPPPRPVARAVRFLWISLALSIPAFLYEFERARGSGELAIGLATTALVVALAVWVITSIARRKRWARLVMAVLTVLEVGVLLFADAPPEQAVIEAVCNGVAAVLDVVAMVMLFGAAASAWFRQGSARPPE